MNEEAVHFFNDLSPSNFYQHQDLCYQLMEKLYLLTGGNAPFVSPATGGEGGGEARPKPRLEICVVAV